MATTTAQMGLLSTALSPHLLSLAQVGDVAIVHTHGPKPEMSLCVIEYLQRNVKKKLGWEPKHVIHRKNEIVEHCGIQVRQGLGVQHSGRHVDCTYHLRPP